MNFHRLVAVMWCLMLLPLAAGAQTAVSGSIAGTVRDVARFKPKTHQWIEYVLPTPWSLDFNSWIDNSTDPPTFWYGDQLGYIVRIQALE